MDENAEEREGRLVAAIPEDTFANRVMLARAFAGHLSQRAAAEKCGLNYATWANWERGERPRDILGVADAIAEGLGIDHDWLLYGGPLRKIERSRRGRVAYARRSIRPGGRRPRRLDRRERVPA